MQIYKNMVILASAGNLTPYVHPTTHSPSIIEQDASNRFVTDAQISAWNSGTGGTSYTHPVTHAPSIIEQDASNRFVSDAEKTTWNNKGDPYTHPTTHAPSIIQQDASNRFVTDAEKTAWNQIVSVIERVPAPTVFQCTAYGVLALNSTIVGGSSNTAIGFEALSFNTTGSANTAIGALTLKSCSVDSDRNTAVGFAALESFVTGDDQTALGNMALRQSTWGYQNVCIGSMAGYSITTGSSNIVIDGHSTTQGITVGNNNTLINADISNGFGLFNITSQDNRILMGSLAVTHAYVNVAWTVVSDQRDKTDFDIVPHGLDFVSKLTPIAYRYKPTRDSVEGHGPLRYGFKAQEVLALEGDNPVIIDVEDLEKLKLNDQSLIAVLVNAIKELRAEFYHYKSTHP